MLILTLLVTNPESKIYFLEKCGLPLNCGRIMLTRFKYLARCCSDSDSIEILKAMSQSPIRDSRERLFWYVEHDEDSISKKKFGMREVKITILGDLKEPENLDKLPDPIYNVVGVFLMPEDFIKQEDVRSRDVSLRENSAPKRSKKNTNRALNNKSMNNEGDLYRDKNNSYQKPQTQRITQRSSKVSGGNHPGNELPIKDVLRKSQLDKTYDGTIKPDLGNTYTSPTNYHNSSRIKPSSKFNLNLSAVRKVS